MFCKHFNGSINPSEKTTKLLPHSQHVIYTFVIYVMSAIESDITKKGKVDLICITEFTVLWTGVPDNESAKNMMIKITLILWHEKD